MAGRMRISAAGLELIKSFEGFRATATRLPDGRWTIGYGHVRTAREGLTITPKDAEDLLIYDLQPVEEAIASSVFAPLMQNQFDALVSLAFNISPGQFRESQILPALNAGDYLSAAAGFDLWRKARIHGRLMVVDALVRRRAAEKAMFLDHPSGPPAAPTPVVTPELDLETPTRAGAATQPGSREPDDGDRPPAPAGDVAEAVRRMAQLAQESISPAPQISLPPGAKVVGPDRGAGQRPAAASPADDPSPAPPRTPDEIDRVRRVVAERVSRILDRAEKRNGAPEAASPAPEPPVTATERQAQPVREGLPDFDAPAERMDPPARPRPLIDDTEVFDPGRRPDEMFAEAERKARIVNGAAKRLGPLSGRLLLQAPWLIVLMLSAVGFAIGAAEALRDGGPEAGAPRVAGAVLAVFGVMLVMSLYFLLRDRSSGEKA